jgi:capsular exopolysaccharide synthesis family protein
MDKLEKAMEKARKDRESNTGGTYVTGKPNFISTQKYETLATATTLPLEDELFEQNRILAHHARSPEADIFRILRTQVLQIMNKSDFRTLAITSPRYGDGKSTISLNLALSIALDLKQTVLLVDLDLRKPTLQKFLGLEDPSGIADYLTANTPIASCLSRLSFERLSILPGGKSLDNSSEILGSPKMATLAQELKMRYRDRLVIYDMPPVLEQDDSIAFLPHVEATIVVVRDGVTSSDDLKTSLERLASANVIGTVLNNAAQG